VNRRQWFRTSAGAGSLAMIPMVGFGTRRSDPHLFVVRTPACLCCESWAQQLRSEGFTVTVSDSDVLSSVKDRLHVPLELRACHTGLVEGYVIEGHVPAPFIRKLLKENPKVAGIALPEGAPDGRAFVITAFGDGAKAEFKL
jgi:hypothetical protein